MPLPPPRISVLVASNARKAVVLRRGQSREVASLLWDLRTDKVELCQWFRGRIYEGSADISPDGRHWIYWAATYHNADPGHGSWVVLADAGWLCARVLWPAFGGLWAGGTFRSSQRFSVLAHEQPASQNDYLDRVGLEREKTQGMDGEEWVRHGHQAILLHRLKRDGWSQEACSKEMVQLTRSRRGWFLEKTVRGGMVYSGRPAENHRLVNPTFGQSIELDGWGDFDGNSVVYASDGCLWRLSLDELEAPPRAPHDRTTAAKCILDLTEMRFERRRAPYDTSLQA